MFTSRAMLQSRSKYFSMHNNISRFFHHICRLSRSRTKFMIANHEMEIFSCFAIGELITHIEDFSRISSGKLLFHFWISFKHETEKVLRLKSLMRSIKFVYLIHFLFNSSLISPILSRIIDSSPLFRSGNYFLMFQ